MEHIGIFLRQDVPQMQGVLERLEQFLAQYKSKLLFEEHNTYGKKGVGLEVMEKECKFLISLGGDGTLISTLHKINTLPVLGVNAGNLGFLTSVSLQDFFTFLPSLFAKEYEIREHSMLCVFLEGKRVAYALNEVLISKKTFPAMIEIDATINQVKLNSYRCDGLIVATPTGSTAYNISAGGSVLYPYCKNILLTPLAPHSLTQRPLIVDEEAKLEFKTRQDSQIIIDGQKVFDFSPCSVLKIGYEGESAKLIYPKHYDYFAVLREKFNWGN